LACAGRAVNEDLSLARPRPTNRFGALLRDASGRLNFIFRDGSEKMPWEPEDAPRHTHKADTRELCEVWAEVANKILAETDDEGRAIRTANAVVARLRARRADAAENG
jgi:hypothetical protein